MDLPDEPMDGALVFFLVVCASKGLCFTTFMKVGEEYSPELYENPTSISVEVDPAGSKWSLGLVF